MGMNTNRGVSDGKYLSLSELLANVDNAIKENDLLFTIDDAKPYATSQTDEGGQVIANTSPPLYANPKGGSAVAGLPVPTSGYFDGQTSGSNPTINIVAPAGKKIIFTHFRPIFWSSTANMINLGNRYDGTNVVYHQIDALTIDGIAQSIDSSFSNAMGRMQGGTSSASKDVSFSHPFTGYAMSSFSMTLTMLNATAAIAYTYYLADE